MSYQSHKKYGSHCRDCDKYFKSIGYSDTKAQCKHINTNKHQRNKLKNDNKSFNTLLSLVRNNVNSDLIGEINKRVIQNYEKENDKFGYDWQYEGMNKNIQSDLCDTLYTKYDYQGVRQITTNTHIKDRLLINDKNYQLINQFGNWDMVDRTHTSIKDFDLRQKYQMNMYKLTNRLFIMNEVIKHIIRNRLNDDYGLVKDGDDTEIMENMEELYRPNEDLDDNVNIRVMIEELEAFIDDAPISLVYN
jgi:hypothetical protein